jgi:hypothetical protein
MKAFTEDYSSLQREKHTSWPIFTDATMVVIIVILRNPILTLTTAMLTTTGGVAVPEIPAKTALR